MLRKGCLDRTEPDRGYAWCILGISWYIHILGFSTCTAFGVLYPWIVTYFKVTHFNTSMMAMALTASMGLAGPVLGPVLKRCGSRPVAMVACAIHGGSLLLTGFFPSKWLFYLSIAIIPGICMGCQKMSGIAACQEFFVKNRGLAMGLSTSGISVATFIYPPVTAWLLGKVGWCGTLAIEGSIQLVGVAIGLFLCPIDAEDEYEILEGATEEQDPPEKVKDLIGHVLEDEASPGCADRACSCCPRKLLRKMGWDYMLRLDYLVFWLGLVCNQIGHGTAFYLPVRGLGLGLSLQAASFLLPAAGISSTLARFGIGFTLDFESVKSMRPYILGISSTLTGLVTVISAIVNNFYVLYSYAAFYGLFSAYYTILEFLVLIDLYGQEDACIFVGHTQASFGVSRVILNLISGVLLGMSPDASLPFLYNGLIQMTGGLLLFICALYKLGNRKQYEHV